MCLSFSLPYLSSGCKNPAQCTSRKRSLWNSSLPLSTPSYLLPVIFSLTWPLVAVALGTYCSCVDWALWSGFLPFFPDLMLETEWRGPQIIWPPGALSTIDQIACAVGTSPVFYYPEDCLPFSQTWVMWGACFAMVLASEGTGSRRRTEERETTKRIS